jgi:hypothetical protein
MLAIEPALTDWSTAPLGPDLDNLDESASNRIRDGKPDAMLHLAAQSLVVLCAF